MIPGSCFVEYVAVDEGNLLSGGGLEEVMGDVVGKVFACEVGGLRGDVEAEEAESGGVKGEEGGEEERDAACACAKVEDAEGVSWG